MKKNHSPKISEKELERFVGTLLQSTVLTDEEVEKIADSPSLRQQLQIRIAGEKARREKRRAFVWQWQWATAAAALALLFSAGALFRSMNAPETEIAFVPNEKSAAAQAETKPPEAESEAPSAIASPSVRRKTSFVKTTKIAAKVNSLRVRFTERKSEKAKSARLPKTEIATEFIALSYLPATESGQVVRVKVPRSMMVSLGVTTKLERSSELVNAEVVIGDDGAARAIRFLAN